MFSNLVEYEVNKNVATGVYLHDLCSWCLATSVVDNLVNQHIWRITLEGAVRKIKLFKHQIINTLVNWYVLLCYIN